MDTSPSNKTSSELSFPILIFLKITKKAEKHFNGKGYAFARLTRCSHVLLPSTKPPLPRGSLHVSGHVPPPGSSSHKLRNIVGVRSLLAVPIAASSFTEPRKPRPCLNGRGTPFRPLGSYHYFRHVCFVGGVCVQQSLCTSPYSFQLLKWARLEGWPA